MRSLFRKLQNPFVLVAQGFVIGGVMLWTAQGEANVRPAHPAPVSVFHNF